MPELQSSNILEISRCCTKCGESKLLSEYFKASRSRDRLMTECKVCANAYRKEWGKKRSILPFPGIKKKCSGCEIEKSLNEFYNDKKGLYGKGYKCSSCSDESGKKYTLMNVEKVRIARRRRLLKRNYNMSLETYNALFSSQGGQCAICRKPLVKNTKNNAPTHVDHNHVTGEVRGILCTQCNSGLGHFKDKIEVMRLAIKYLEDRGS